MITVRKMISAGVATALIVTSVTPAFARRHDRGYGHGYDYGHGYGRHHRGHDDLDTGDVIGILAVVGLVAAIASSGKAKRRAREAGGYDSGPYQKGAITSENEAVDACALAAEARAGKMSSVREVTKVSVNEGGWDIAGTIEARDDWRERAVQTRGFNCVVREGTVKAVFVDVNAVAAQ
jgi:hypothetical protein